MLIKTPLLHQSSGPHVFLFLSLSLSLRLFLWSAEAIWVHFPALASKTLSRRCCEPSPHQEGTWGLRKQSKPHARSFIGFLHKPRNITLFLSPSLSYHQLQTTRFQSIKGSQQCLTLSDPMDCSPPGSSIHGIFQARILEWVAIAFSVTLYKM